MRQACDDGRLHEVAFSLDNLHKKKKSMNIFKNLPPMLINEPLQNNELQVHLEVQHQIIMGAFVTVKFKIHPPLTFPPNSILPPCFTISATVFL